MGGLIRSGQSDILRAYRHGKLMRILVLYVDSYRPYNLWPRA